MYLHWIFPNIMHVLILKNDTLVCCHIIIMILYVYCRDGFIRLRKTCFPPATFDKNPSFYSLFLYWYKLTVVMISHTIHIIIFYNVTIISAPYMVVRNLILKTCNHKNGIKKIKTRTPAFRNVCNNNLYIMSKYFLIS